MKRTILRVGLDEIWRASDESLHLHDMEFGLFGKFTARRYKCICI